MPEFDPMHPEYPLRVKLIACEILHREICACIATSPNIVDIQFLTKGLHNLPSEKMMARVQEEIDATNPERYAAILLGYALCNNGVVGLGHAELPVIIPRSHDCIALFLGSRRAYDEYFNENPGTYYKTSGWIERNSETLEDAAADASNPLGALKTFEEMVEKYGLENAQYLMETLYGLKNYTRMSYIDVPGMAPLPYADQTRAEAEGSGLTYDYKEGQLGWIRRLTDGPWDDSDFLVLQPGQRIAPSHNDTILRAE
jgi:hypothetical protein